MSFPLLPLSLRQLLDDLEHLPGIGSKGAQRIAFYLLRQPAERLKKLARDILRLGEGVQHCEICGMLADSKECQICKDPSRDKSVLCVVEGPFDVIAIERTGEYRGRYHVLGGVLSPLDNVGPKDLNIPSLVKRVREEKPHEVILALNPSTEGETTALYLKKVLSEERVVISRLAQGLPTGAALEYADDLTITRAFSGRQKLSDSQTTKLE